MADQNDEDLQMALRMSLQTQSEAQRSKSREHSAASAASGSLEESPEAKSQRRQRELMAAAAEKRLLTPTKSSEVMMTEMNAEDVADAEMSEDVSNVSEEKTEADLNFGKELSLEETEQLFYMVFGDSVSREVLAQWTNQGIRFSSDPETCMGLVQHEGGPCGVLATIQAFILKYLLFFPDELGKNTANLPSQNLGPSRFSQSDCVTMGNFASLTEDGKARALVQSMVEILFMCGSKRRAIVATVDVFHNPSGESENTLNDEIVAKSLEGLPLESASDLQKVIRVSTYTSPMSAFDHLKTVLPFFRSRLGAMLFLISALLSRGLESVQADRDDPSLPLVTAPFGHASQEIVNLLLCGQAAPNVFDGRMDLGGGMFLKGIPMSVEVGFLSLLESLNFCKVGQNLKCPKWPIWVVGSESHYSVLFTSDPNVQNENELEARESLIRRAFDAQDQSGGGGFISVEGLHQVLRETNINLPQDKLDNLCSMGFIVWSEFWQVLLDLDKSLGGMKDSTGLMGTQLFDLYHFNGIAKSVLIGNQSTSSCESSLQRPRLSKLRVSVPPRWTSGGEDTDEVTIIDVMPPKPQHAPLVDCIRTRWPRAVCNWVGDPPSIV